MALLGCKPPGRYTEQHDVFFGIAHNLAELLPAMSRFWPEAAGKFHIDAWRAVTHVDGYAVTIAERTSVTAAPAPAQLFFLNLGGYKPGEFEEYHYKMLVAEADKTAAIQRAKQTAFYQHTGFTGATSHIDDKYGVDVDDAYEIADILPVEMKEKYSIVLKKQAGEEDPFRLGYLTPEKLRRG